MGNAGRRMRFRGVGRIFFSPKASFLSRPGAKMASRGGWMDDARFCDVNRKRAKIRHSRSRLPRFAALYCTLHALVRASFSAARSPGSFSERIPCFCSATHQNRLNERYKNPIFDKRDDTTALYSSLSTITSAQLSSAGSGGLYGFAPRPASPNGSELYMLHCASFFCHRRLSLPNCVFC